MICQISMMIYVLDTLIHVLPLPYIILIIVSLLNSFIHNCEHYLIKASRGFLKCCFVLFCLIENGFLLLLQLTAVLRANKWPGALQQQIATLPIFDVLSAARQVTCTWTHSQSVNNSTIVKAFMQQKNTDWYCLVWCLNTWLGEHTGHVVSSLYCKTSSYVWGNQTFNRFALFFLTLVQLLVSYNRNIALFLSLVSFSRHLLTFHHQLSLSMYLCELQEHWYDPGLSLRNNQFPYK